MIKDFQGSLLDAPVDSIGHCANCFSTMGNGIALAIKKEYPEIYDVDKSLHLSSDARFGRISVAHVRNINNHTNKQINYLFNLYAQYNYGYYKRHVDYEKLYTSLDECQNYLIRYNIKSIGLPYNMCCRLAGGHWKIVSAIIETIFEKSNIDVYICKIDK